MMLQKFALAVKAKTIEFFAEDEDATAAEADGDADADDADSISAFNVLDDDPAPEAVITDQRVVVLRPDPPNPSPSAAAAAVVVDPETLASAAFAVSASFAAAHLHLQAAHSPLDADAARDADVAAVSLLRLLSDLKRAHQNPGGGDFSLTAILERQVRENQRLLRASEAVVNRLQSAADARDAEADELRRRLSELDSVNERLAARLDRACVPPLGVIGGVEAMLGVGVFEPVLRDALRCAHRLALVLAAAMCDAGWDIFAAAEAAYPGVRYAKRGHCRYALLSRLCLAVFDGFDSYSFGSKIPPLHDDLISDVPRRRNESLRQFIDHSSADPFELMSSNPDCEFAQFYHDKCRHLNQSGVWPRILAKPKPDLPVATHELMVSTVSAVWALHKLAWAYDPPVGIFQVGKGAEFSAVYMEDVIVRRKVGSARPGPGVGHWANGSRPVVGFTVTPGFRIGKTVIQCRVYLDSLQDAAAT